MICKKKHCIQLRSKDSRKGSRHPGNRQRGATPESLAAALGALWASPGSLGGRIKWRASDTNIYIYIVYIHTYSIFVVFRSAALHKTGHVSSWRSVALGDIHTYSIYIYILSTIYTIQCILWTYIPFPGPSG